MTMTHKFAFQGEGVDVKEILAEGDDNSAQKTIPLILPPTINNPLTECSRFLAES